MRTRLTTSRALCEQSDDADSAFKNWNPDENPRYTNKPKILESLVAWIKDGHPFNDSLEDKAVLLLDRIRQSDSREAEGFINLMTRPAIVSSSMCMLDHLFCHCSPQFRLKLIEAQLIPQIIISLNPQSLVVRETLRINASLLRLIASSLDLATPEELALLEVMPHREQQKVFQTVHNHVLVPSKSYILHLCEHRYSIEIWPTSFDFVRVLYRLLQISPYYQRTMNFVLKTPIILTIPSCLTFFEKENDIRFFGSDILISVGIVWPFSERIIVRMNALSHIAVHNVIPLPSRPNCAEQVLPEALDNLEMLHKAFPVADHEPNSADMLATCFALQSPLSTWRIATLSPRGMSVRCRKEQSRGLSLGNGLRRASARWMDGSGKSVDDVKVAVGLVEGSFGSLEAGDAHRATPHPRQPASPASPHDTHGRMMREVVGRLQVRGQLDGRDRRMVCESTHPTHSDRTDSRAAKSEDCVFVVNGED
ncbi:hypothetical protein BLNAU_15337 [Blattamonas nauphoetae]|uniref:Uncharacterized protein n=1 Tax=Blattamonas nauphoetae TaxID=2049346 RepID=A0ABQ9XB61_9EUKA|nr:hypothetical protein BLNAU_15337 [Blattamonas nauphoetae]